jgi:hypothetical protein
VPFCVLRLAPLRYTAQKKYWGSSDDSRWIISMAIPSVYLVRRPLSVQDSDRPL